MLAVQFTELGAPEVLTVGSAADPHPGPGEVRVRVEAAGVSPVDVALRAGRSPSAGRLTLPHVPGVDAAGVVDELGEGVAGVAVGDEVLGAVDVSRLGGATAELAVLQLWTPKPAAMSWAEAAACATSIETATRALDLLEVRPGSSLLVDGAAGGVGSVATQLGVARGARVIGTARAAHQQLVSRLGATPTTYGPGLPERLRALDVDRVDRALDAAGRGSLPELVALTGSADTVVTIADLGAADLGVRLSLGDLGGQPNGRHGLATATALVEQGRFHVPVRAVFGAADAGRAHALVESGGGSGAGRVVISLR